MGRGIITVQGVVNLVAQQSHQDSRYFQNFHCAI